MDNIFELKTQIDLLQIIGRDTQLKRVSSTRGGEWQGPCPWCGGKDRFKVQPKEGKWFCRQCGRGGADQWHDVFDYLRERDGLDYSEALAYLQNKFIDNAKTWANIQQKEKRENDRTKWEAAARELIAESTSNLWSGEGEKARNYLHYRGLLDSTILQWRLGYNLSAQTQAGSLWGLDRPVVIEKGIIIPTIDYRGIHAVEVRRRSTINKYQNVTGSVSWLFGVPTFANTEIVLLFEGAIDTMLAVQCGLDGIGYASIPANISPLKPEFDEFWKNVKEVVVVFDNDKPGQDAANKLAALSPHIHKGHLPKEFHDFGDLCQQKGMEAALSCILKNLDVIHDNRTR